ncbi:3-keto-5-aminohexanoate cleavage protein [Trinickia soli]|uniref:3-keto-5-aminohexanoate cleavage protein n=1 Tax=Trinickia soli TaxID=380675 RepID=UPI002AA5D100
MAMLATLVRSRASVLTYGAVMSSHGRVGLEDSLYLGAREKAKSNAEQVRKIRRILEELGIEVAAPDEARQLLGLEGRDEVAF